MIKTYARVTKNNTSVRLSIERTIVDLLDMRNTKKGEVWEIYIKRKLDKKALQKELKKEV